MSYLKVLFSVMFVLPTVLCTGQYITYAADPSRDRIEMFWKDDRGNIFETINNLKKWLDGRGRRLLFATNGGMFMEDLSPLGLYVENGKLLRGLNLRNGNTNFYIKPQGVFCVTKDHKAFICRADAYSQSGNIEFATQSAPMLVINGTVNAALRAFGKSKLIRSGVGIRPDSCVVFALSEYPVTFIEFARYFLSLKCTDAMFLDGSISEMYLPEKNLDDCPGSFGVIIAVTRQAKK